ncbi:MAG: RusA family crossover junction endodeoxyribonuclease [Candidatus Moranbacteria bacterium]|nr:RusA family crossover junction endodeoxyribonuclease [Candidatus Moranbacteria bacterium]
MMFLSMKLGQVELEVQVSKKKIDLDRIETNKKKVFKIDLPLPVSLNHMYINIRGGGKRLNKRAEEYMRVARSLVNEAMLEQNWKMTNQGYWYYVDMIFYLPDVRIRDNHNMFKLLFDVLEGYVFCNDYYIMPRVESVELDRSNPRIELRFHTQTIKEREKILNHKK